MGKKEESPFATALSYLLKEKGLRANKECAEATGVSKGYITILANGSRDGAEATRRKIAGFFNLGYEHMLLLGLHILDGNSAEDWRAVTAFPDFPMLQKNLEMAQAYLANSFDLIPKYRARLSGGGGSFEDSDQIKSNFAFRKDWISKKNVSNLALFEVVGESMAPFIQEGDVVLVDLDQNQLEQVVDGKTYAIREDSTVKIKRLLRQGGELIVRSQDRDNFPDYTASHEDLCLIGKVLWVGHEVK